MCGISGIVTVSGGPPDRDVLARMSESIAHRGPDDSGMIVGAGAGFAHRRLTILDPDSGSQPMVTGDNRFWLTYNGEIYNYREINRELAAEGYCVEGRCDTETLLKAWQCWGAGCVSRLRGMFAFAIWDGLAEQVHLVRDRLGIKPLYYATTQDGDLIFGSELKALTAHPRLGRELEPRAVETYMALGYVPEPYAIFKGSRKLPAGHTLIWDRTMRSNRPHRYWDVRFPAMDSVDRQVTNEDLTERLAEAVRMRRVSDVPLGAFLSGGIDSSAVVSFLAEDSAEPVNTCAVGFDDAAFDETGAARRVATYLNTNHHEYRVDTNDFDLVERLPGVYDEPFADSSALPTYLVCKLARRQVKVALSGDGGDENFAGYRRYHLHQAESRTRARMPGAVRRPFFGALGQIWPKMDWAPRPLRAKTTLQALALSHAEAYCHSVSVIPRALREQLYSPALRCDLQGFRAVDMFRGHAAGAGTDDPLSLAQYLDFKTWLPGDILTKVDRASMAHGLEVRVPMLDHEFVNRAAMMPSEYKLHRGQGKHVLKQALAPRLPHDVLYRTKQGFSVPLADWFRGPLREVGENALTGDALAESGLFDPGALDRLWQLHCAGSNDYSRTIWSLLMLSRFIERESGTEASSTMRFAAIG